MKTAPPPALVLAVQALGREVRELLAARRRESTDREHRAGLTERLMAVEDALSELREAVSAGAPAGERRVA